LGLVHRDLKPDNVLLTARGLRILDFGLARAIASDDPRLTRTGLVCGTPRYMSPEQASGDPIDARSDIYAVGVLLHEMLRGEPMFDGANAAAVLRQQIVDAPPKLELKPHPEVDTERLTQVVERALKKDVERRHADATALAAELEACRGRRSRRRKTRWLAAALLALLVGLGVLAATRVLKDPLVEARAALATGQLDMARSVLEQRLRDDPGDAEARLLLGRADWAAKRAAAAARAWTEAIRAEPEVAGAAGLLEAVPEVVARLHEGTRRERARGAALVTSLAERGAPSGAPLLARLTEEAPTFRLRRKAFEGLERLGATDAVDELGFLTRELRTNRTGRCELRRWYVKRLAALGGPEAEALVAAEKARRRARCLQDI
jgi:tetratricopeptide (TPR) repeat protein